MASKPEVSPVCLHGPVRLYLVIMTEMSMCSGKRKMLPMQITCRNQTSVLAKKNEPFQWYFSPQWAKCRDLAANFSRKI